MSIIGINLENFGISVQICPEDEHLERALSQKILSSFRKIQTGRRHHGFRWENTERNDAKGFF